MADAQALLLQVSADTSKAEKRLKAFEDKLKGVGKTVDKISNDNQKGLDRFFGKPSAAGALDKIFDSTRFKILDTGAARVGLFGSALEKLGVVGLTTAAAIGALAFALNQAGEAIKFADELEDTANRLHVTTDALQEYRYAIRALGGDEKGADEALEAFSVTLGKAQAGFPKAIKAFKELGFTDAQIKGFTDVDSTLVAVNEKISKLKSPAQKDAVVEQLGLTGLKEAVEGLPQDFAAARAEAHKMGVVFDSELIHKASGLEDQLQTINERISIDMKSAFVSLGPVLVDLKAGLAGVLEFVLQIIDGFRKMENRSRITLQGQLDAAQERKAELTQQYGTRIPMSKVSQFRNAEKIIAENSLQLAKMDSQAELRRQGENAKSVWDRKAGGSTLIDPNAGKQAAAAAKKAAEQQKHFDDEMAKAAEAILAAHDDELHTLAQRQDIAVQRLKTEDAARLKAIDDEVATGAITKAQGERLKVAQDDVLIAKANQLVAQQLKAQRELELKQQQDVAAAMAGYLDAQLGIAGTAKERADLEAEILTAQRSIARKVLVEQLNDPNVTPLQRGLTLGLFDRTTGALETNQAAKARADILGKQLALDQASLQAQIDTVQIADQLAETAKDRRAAELKLLDLQYQAQRAQLDYIIQTSQSADDIKKARIDRAALDAGHAGQRQGVLNSTRGPLEQFTAGLPTDAAKLNEALQNVSAHGLQSLEDGLVAVIGHTKKLGDVFREVASQIVADLARIAIQRAIIGPLESVLSAAFGGVPGLGNIIGGGKAIGGPVFPGHIYPINEKGLEGFVPGVAGTIIPHDAIRAAATAGGGRSVTVLQTVQFDARGALMFKDYTLQQNRQMVALAGAAAREATQRSLAGVGGALTQQQQHAG